MIKLYLTAVILILNLPLPGHATKTNDIQYSKEIEVNGMVCAFCSNSLEKKFKKEKNVESVHVDLEKRRVLVKFKKGQSLTDENLVKIISSSGFDVVNIRDLRPPENPSNKKPKKGDKQDNKQKNKANDKK